MLISREDILKAQDLKTKDITVPEWGGDIRIRELLASEREVFERETIAAQADPGGMTKILGRMRVRMLVLCLVDEDNKGLFTEKDIVELNKKSASVVHRVFQACMDLSGMSKEAAEGIAGESEGIIDDDS